MTTLSLSGLVQPTRSLEWLIGPDALLSSTALSTGQLASLGPIASTVEDGLDLSRTEGAVSGLTSSATDIANQAVLDVHAALENLGHEVAPLNAPLHALTALGETVGFGRIGDPGNLLTDLTALPAQIGDGGGLASATPALNDLGRALGATDGLIGSVAGTATGGNPLVADGLLAPVSSLANGAALDVGADLASLGHDLPLLNEALHGLTALGASAGLGQLGTDGNLLTDVVGLPGGLSSGQGLEALSPILGDLGHVTGVATGLLGDVVGIPGSLLGGAATGTPLDGALAPVTALLDGGSLGGDLLGPGGALQPVGVVANGVIDGVHADIEALGHDIPILNTPLHAVINLGTTTGLGALGEGSNLLTDVANLPGDVLSGNGPAGIGQVVADAGHVADAAGGVVGSVPGVIDGVLSTAGGLDGGGAPLTGLLGGLSGGGGPGTHPLVDVAAGPETSTPVANAGILTPQADPAHTVQVGAVGVGADQPSLLTAGLLSGDAIHFPTTGGGGGDALVGHALDIVHTATAGSTDVDASHGAGIDLGVLAVDLGGHAEAHHADPTPHGATSGLHLLGL